MVIKRAQTSANPLRMFQVEPSTRSDLYSPCSIRRQTREQGLRLHFNDYMCLAIIFLRVVLDQPYVLHAQITQAPAQLRLRTCLSRRARLLPPQLIYGPTS